jgi:hypothetical protein
MLMIPHYLDSRITDGSEVVSLTHRPCFTYQKDFLDLIFVRVVGISAVQLEGLGKLKKLSGLIWH